MAAEHVLAIAIGAEQFVILVFLATTAPLARHVQIAATVPVRMVVPVTELVSALPVSLVIIAANVYQVTLALIVLFAGIVVRTAPALTVFMAMAIVFAPKAGAVSCVKQKWICLVSLMKNLALKVTAWSMICQPL